MYAGPQVEAGSPSSEKSIWWVWYGHIHTIIYIYICVCDLDYTLDAWFFPESLSIGGSVAGMGGVAHFAVHISPTGLREVALLETILWTGG